MNACVVLYAMGRDRVGVADDLATALAIRQIDIEHSRMTALGGTCARAERGPRSRTHPDPGGPRARVTRRSALAPPPGGASQAGHDGLPLGIPPESAQGARGARLVEDEGRGAVAGEGCFP